jgi:phosphoribosylaminoimidazolecarboxamide formyltransferase / IMP cyclohydrolase
MAEIFRALSHSEGGSGQGNSLAVKNAPQKMHSDHSKLLEASEAVPDLVSVRTAIATVSDKTGLLELGRELGKNHVEVIATEGTAKHLSTVDGLRITDLTGYTSYPENLNGRLKTLHPKIQAGVLAIKGYHDDILAKEGVEAKFIDLVIANLYPFERVVDQGAPFFECIENIDIGGPALLRAGAKNHVCVTVICDPADYGELISEIRRYDGKTSLEFRRKCAWKVFQLTSKYDAMIATWFESQQETVIKSRRRA